ncbi:MFS transporter [Hymenobacter cavernae]|nr:MFS transporter [Hymenobacter cavernae]
MLSVSAPAYVPKRTHRLAVGAMFFLLGLCFASWASRIPSIQQKLGFSDAVLGLVLFAMPVGLMISLPIAGWLIAKEGSRKVIVAALLLYSVTLVGLGWAQNIMQLALCLFVFGFASNTANISVNTQAVGVEALYGKSIMASFHGLWSLAGFAGAAIGTFMIGLGIVPGQHFLFIMATGVAGAAICSRYLLVEDHNVNPDQPIFVKPDKELLTLGLIAFFSLICEGAMFDWSGVYFKKIVQPAPSLVGAGFTAFMSTMALGRFGADWFKDRFGLRRTLQLSGALTAGGLLLAVVIPLFATAVLGFFLVGFGVSSVVPLVYSAAGKSKTMSPGSALAAVSTIGFLGFLLGPPMIGLVAGATSLRVSFIIVAIMGMATATVATKAKL